MWLDTARGGTGRLVLCVGEPGIGKTRLAQELAGVALAGGTTVSWGRCVEAEGAPAFWPWRQVLRTLGVEPDAVLRGDVESPEDRFRVFDDVARAVRAAVGGGLAVILDDVHWADEPSLLTLRHLADQIAADRLLVFATFRDVEPASLLRRVLPDLLRGPATERVDLRGFGLAEVREQLARTGGGQSGEDARVVLDVTGGNPLFVREVARAMADGTWRPDRPPSTVLDSSMPVSAVDQVGDVGDYQFVHALTRDAVRASLATAERIELHRAVALATEATFAGDLSEYLGDIARHWAELAPDGEAAAARTWTIRAAEEAVRRLAYEEAVRLYNVALALPVTSGSDSDRCRILVALGRAAHSAGDVSGSVDAAQQASDAALAAGSPELMAEAALVLEAIADPAVNAVAKRLCEQALGGLVDDGSEAMRARLLARQAHLAFYDGDHSPTSAGHDPPR